MKENTEKAIQYLFGELGDAERDALEDRIFADEEFAIFLSAVEKDLVDEYVRGEMNADLHRRFEQKYLISETRREKVRAAEILQKELFRENEVFAPVAVVEAKPSFWQTIADFFRVPNLAWAGGLATLLLLILGSWLLWRQSSNPTEIVKDKEDNRQFQIPTPQISPETLPTVEPNNNSNTAENQEQRKSEKKPVPTKTPVSKPEKSENIPPPQPRIFVATLLPITRSGETPVLTIPKNTQNVQLRVVHDNQKEFIKYRAEIRDSGGNMVWSREFPVNQKSLTRPINLNIRSGTLTSGSYELTLSGITADTQLEEIKFYNFTVKKK